MVKSMSITQTMCIYLMTMTVNTRDYIKPSECVQLQHKQNQKKKKMLLQGIDFFFSNRFCKKVKYCLLKRNDNQTKRLDRHKTNWTNSNYHLRKCSACDRKRQKGWSTRKVVTKQRSGVGKKSHPLNFTSLADKLLHISIRIYMLKQTLYGV